MVYAILKLSDISSKSADILHVATELYKDCYEHAEKTNQVSVHLTKYISLFSSSVHQVNIEFNNRSIYLFSVIASESLLPHTIGPAESRRQNIHIDIQFR